MASCEFIPTLSGYYFIPDINPPNNQPFCVPFFLLFFFNRPSFRSIPKTPGLCTKKMTGRSHKCEFRITLPPCPDLSHPPQKRRGWLLTFFVDWWPYFLLFEAIMENYKPKPVSLFLLYIYILFLDSDLFCWRYFFVKLMVNCEPTCHEFHGIGRFT